MRRIKQCDGALIEPLNFVVSPMTFDINSRPRTKLYLITPPQIADPIMFRDQLLEFLNPDEVACLQIRMKTSSGEFDRKSTHAVAEALLGPLKELEIDLIINDCPETAKELGADGVHVGLEDTTVKDARNILGEGKIVGATCKQSRHIAMEAGEAGADYVAFGSFYSSSTKTDTTPASIEILSWWQALMELPCIAIGGVAPDNAAPLVRAGADFIAASASIWNHPQGPAFSVKEFNNLFDELYESQPYTRS